MGLKPKILVVIAGVFLLHFLFVGYLGYRQIKTEVIEDIQEQARIVRGMLMALRTVYQRQFLSHNIPVNEQTLGILPAYSISLISDEFKEWVSTGLSFNNVAEEPRNPKNAADAIELEAIRYFAGHEGESERLVPYTNATGESYYHYSQPIQIQTHCLNCHGSAEEASPSIQERYTTAYDYKVGDLRGIMSIKLPASVIEERIWAQLKQNVITHTAGLILSFLLLSAFLSKTILAPIARLRRATKRLAEGDYSIDEAPYGKDEIAAVSHSFDKMAREVGRREKALSTQKALYAALSETNKTILRLDAPEQFFSRVCNIAVDYGGLQFAWIGLLEPENNEIKVVASAGGSIRLRKPAFSLDIEGPFGKSPVADAVRGKRLIVIDDLFQQMGTTPCYEFATETKLKSSAIFPILEKGEVIGSFNLYATEPYYFNEDIQDLLEEMTSEITFAIQNYRRDQEHRLAHQKLEESSRQLGKINNQMRLLLESTGEGIFGTDTKGLCTLINQAAIEMFGFPRDEMLGQSIHDLTHHSYKDGSPYPFDVCPIYLACESDTPYQITNEVFWRKDGTCFPVEYSAYPIHESGQVIGTVTLFRDVTERHVLNERMDFLTTHDPLTKLLNRYAFEQRLQEVVEDARQNNTEHALCYMDLDQFKVVNDTCGHVAGDAMLQMLTEILHGTLRQSDTLARLGGDEFGLLLEGASLEQALHLAYKICHAVKEFRFSWEGKSFATGISIGIVVIGPNGEKIRNLLSAADAACYVAKDMGRNRVHVYRIKDEEVARRQGEMKWVSEIQTAMEQKRLSLNFQPIRRLDSSNTDECIEILLSMIGNNGQHISPGAFIPAAERYDLIVALDRWVIRQTFEWLAQDSARLARLSICSINLSGQSLGDETLPEFIIAECRRNNLPAEKICFEITETAAVSRLDKAIHLINLLKKLGFHFALDDFGTGMSSFAYLKDLPVDFLKIDGSFVKDILVDPVDCAMVESINQIGHLMGLQTVAEHVENDQLLDKLREIGVDYVQGYGVARPAPLITGAGV